MPKNDSTFTQAPLTRRRFLEQLGMVGGSSLVMTAMNSWNLMAGQAQGRPQLTGKPTKNKVIVSAQASLVWSRPTSSASWATTCG